MLAEYGQEHTVLVLRTIIESEGNAKALTAPIMRAVSALARAYPTWTATGLRWIEAFDTIPLLARCDAVKQLNRSAAAPGWSYLAGMLTVELSGSFADLRKPSRTIAEIRQQREERERVAAESARDAAERRRAATVKSNGEKIAMGLQVAEIRKNTRCNREFGYAVRRRLGYIAGQGSMMRVAKRYSGRPELWRHSWELLVELCSLALSEAHRKQFEAATADGERVTAREIRANRREKSRGPYLAVRQRKNSQ